MSKRGNPKLVKGVSGNPSGRPKGAISKTTQKWNQLCDYLMDDGIERLMNALDTLEPKEYVEAYTKILNYIKPKLQSVDANQTTSMRIVIENELDKLNDNNE